MSANACTQDALFDALAQPLTNLALRWRDECQYENIKDYAEPLRPILAKHSATLVSMIRRPFGVVYNAANGNRYRVTVSLRRGAASCSLVRIL